MSSISSSSAVSSPLVRLQSQLSSDIKAGTIKSADGDALSAALTSIDSSLSAGRSNGGGGASRPDPDSVKTKIGSLIDQQVSSGSLTSDQATELKQLFSNAAPKTGEGGPGGAGGPGGPGGPGGGGGVHGAGGHGGPPPAQASDDDDDDDDSDSTSVTDLLSKATTSSTSSTSDSSDLLADFLKQVQSSLADSYSQSGTTTTSKTSLLFNISA